MYAVEYFITLHLPQAILLSYRLKRCTSLTVGEWYKTQDDSTCWGKKIKSLLKKIGKTIWSICKMEVQRYFLKSMMVQIFIFRSLCQIIYSDFSYRRSLAAVQLIFISKVGGSSFWYLCCLLVVAPLFARYRIESGTAILLWRDGYLWLVTVSYTQISFALHLTSQVGQWPFFSACCLCWHCFWGKDLLLLLKSWPPKCPIISCRWCKEAIQKYAHFLDGQVFGKQVENTLQLCSFKMSPIKASCNSQEWLFWWLF